MAGLSRFFETRGNPPPDPFPWSALPIRVFFFSQTDGSFLLDSALPSNVIHRAPHFPGPHVIFILSSADFAVGCQHRDLFGQVSFTQDYSLSFRFPSFSNLMRFPLSLDLYFVNCGL